MFGNLQRFHQVLIGAGAHLTGGGAQAGMGPNTVVAHIDMDCFYVQVGPFSPKINILPFLCSFHHDVGSKP